MYADTDHRLSFLIYIGRDGGAFIRRGRGSRHKFIQIHRSPFDVAVAFPYSSREAGLTLPAKYKGSCVVQNVL